MSDCDDVVRDLYKYTPRNWAIQNMRGKTCVVIEATNATVATKRVALLLHELPRLPREFKVKEHTGPIHCSWYGNGYFSLREEVEKLCANSELKLLSDIRKLPNS